MELLDAFLAHKDFAWQFLRLQSAESFNTLLLKNGFAIPPTGPASYEVESVLLGATDEQLNNLLGEIVRTQATLRHDISPRYRFDERFEHLQQCLLLDGIRIEGRRLVPVEPSVDGAVQPEDDLVREIGKKREQAT